MDCSKPDETKKQLERVLFPPVLADEGHVAACGSGA